MVIQRSWLLTEALKKKDHNEVAGVCIGWICDHKNYTINDAFQEGLEVGRRNPKKLFSANLGVYTFFFENEKKALKKIQRLPDLMP